MNGVQVAEFDITDETLKAPFHFELRKKRYAVNLDKIRIDRRNFVWIDRVSVEEEAQEFCHIDRN
jgi:hypothetical protein